MAPSRKSSTEFVRKLARAWPLALLLALVALGVAAHFLDWREWWLGLEWARSHAQRGWLVVALILVQVTLFAFALPGSSLIWLVAVLYPPAAATLILVTGTSIGAVAAHFVARTLSASRLDQLQEHRVFGLLRRHGDFIMQCVLRLTPGFPHSIINYGAGVLRLPLTPFFAAAVLGVALKAFLYSSAIHAALAANQPADLLRIEVVAPLVLLAGLLLLAGFIRRRRRSPRS